MVLRSAVIALANWVISLIESDSCEALLEFPVVLAVALDS